jgi:N-glycosidase YbiA
MNNANRVNCPCSTDVGSAIKIIYFYGLGDDYFELSNFYPRPVTIQNFVWPSTEHFYQAQKFIHVLDQEIIRRASSPAEAFYLGRNLAGSRISHWHAIKVLVMRQAIQEKFRQHADLKAILLGTGSAFIKEKSAVDSYWGIGVDGNGQNRLGKLLMEVRESLRTGSSTLNV